MRRRAALRIGNCDIGLQASLQKAVEYMQWKPDFVPERKRPLLIVVSVSVAGFCIVINGSQSVDNRGLKT